MNQVDQTVYHLTEAFSVGRNESAERRQRQATAEERLMSDLFHGYESDSRGVVNVSASVSVGIQFMLLRIQRLVSIGLPITLSDVCMLVERLINCGYL